MIRNGFDDLDVARASPRADRHALFDIAREYDTLVTTMLHLDSIFSVRLISGKTGRRMFPTLVKGR